MRSTVIEYTNYLTYRIDFYRIDITNVIVKRVTIKSFKNLSGNT